MVKRPKHPEKDIEKAIQFAEKMVGDIKIPENLLMLGGAYYAH